MDKINKIYNNDFLKKFKFIRFLSILFNNNL